MSNFQFRVGDIVKGSEESNEHYCFTNDKAICRVTKILDSFRMRVKIIARADNISIGAEYSVNMEYFVLVRDAKEQEENEMKLVNNIVPYVFPATTMETIKRKMSDLLDEYDHPNSDKGLTAILEEYQKNKAELTGILSKHPNWDSENLAIVFSSNFKRNLDKKAVRKFADWFNEQYKKIFCEKHDLKYAGKSYSEWKHFYNEAETNNEREFATEALLAIDSTGLLAGRRKFLSKENYEEMCIVTSLFEKIPRYKYIENEEGQEEKYYPFLDLNEGKINQEIATAFNEVFPTLRAVAGQKLSRVIGKIGKITGVDKVKDIRYDGRDYGWNREYAMFSDAINPLTITRHTVISVNPLDYLTASFGHNWASCHTIDSENKRCMDSGHNYHGMYMSGTLSYMLDGSSMVFYTVDSKYDGREFWTQDKMQRCMFHFQNEKLAQGRVYPDGRDGGDDSLAAQFRTVVQTVLCDCLEIPNLWVKKTRSDMHTYTESNGTNYRDYVEYSDCVMSFLKGTENSLPIQIGHVPICPYCGNLHGLEDSLACEDCKNIICDNCGAYSDPMERIRIGDNTFCCENCAREAGYVRTVDADWQDENECRQDDYTGEWYYYWEDKIIRTEDDCVFMSEENAEAAGYHRAADTGCWYHESEMYECPICGRWFFDSDNYDFDSDCCCECASEREEEEA